MSINIEDITIGQALELSALLGSKEADPHPYEIGKNYIIRTVTMITVGRLVAVYPSELVFLEASWIPETDRYQQFIADGAIKECEPYPADSPVVVGRGAIVDGVGWRTALPDKQK